MYEDENPCIEVADAFAKMSKAMSDMKIPAERLARTIRELDGQVAERIATFEFEKDVIEMGLIDGTVTISTD